MCYCCITLSKGQSINFPVQIHTSKTTRNISYVTLCNCHRTHKRAREMPKNSSKPLNADELLLLMRLLAIPLQSHRHALYSDSNQIAYKVVAYSVTSSVIVCLGPWGCPSVDAEMVPRDATQPTRQCTSCHPELPLQKTQEPHLPDNYIPNRW